MTDKPKTTSWTVTQQRDYARIALGKAIVEQLTALNRACAQARRIGLKIDFRLEGYGDQTPEIKNIYVVSPTGNVRNIWEEVFQCMIPNQ